METCTRNTYRPADVASYNAARQHCLDSALDILVRVRSQKHVPLWTAALSVVAYKRQLDGTLWRMISARQNGLLMSEKWTKQLVADAVPFRPAPKERFIQAVTFTVFDNYTRRCLYKSQVAGGEGGYSLDMTNWGTLRVPLRLLPMNFDGEDVFRNLFRSYISMRSFVASFSWNSPAISMNKEARFVRFLKASTTGELFSRPNTTPSWVCDIDWASPIWGRLQSSHEDVITEVSIQRRQAHARRSFVHIAGGDGLSVMRMNEIIQADPETYLDCSPAVIPMLGEYPHGLHHILHCIHRGFRVFVVRCAKECGNGAIIDDPAAVKHFNSHLYFHFVLIRACSEYVFEISRGDGGKLPSSGLCSLVACSR